MDNRKPGIQGGFTIVPHEVWDRLLGPFDLALYAAMRRVAGQGGLCFASTKHLARLAKMSTGQVSVCKSRLTRLGLVRFVGRFKRAERGQPVDHFALKELNRAMLRHHNRSQPERGRSYRETE